MPKPIFGDNGSGMHSHQSLWKDGQPLFFDEHGYGGLSDLARWYIGGLLEHASSLVAFTNPSTNSFRRLEIGRASCRERVKISVVDAAVERKNERDQTKTR